MNLLKVGDRVRYIGNETLNGYWKNGFEAIVTEVSSSYVRVNKLINGHERTHVYNLTLDAHLFELIAGVTNETKFTAHTTGALRENMGTRYDLFPIEGIEAYSRVAEFGAKKYAPWNWVKGLPRMQVCASLIRHTFAYMRGEDRDPKTGVLHTDSIVWNAVVLAFYHTHNMEDDRRGPKFPTVYTPASVTISDPMAYEDEISPGFFKAVSEVSVSDNFEL